MGINNLNYPYTIDSSKRDTTFTGFSFCGFHSDDLGIVRVSSGDRYIDDLNPSFTDKTITAPGADRTYYFSTDYTQKIFNVNIAFDKLTEERLRALRQVFNAKTVGPLIFDEWPYKVYSAKIQNPPQLKYICFDLDEDETFKTLKEEVFYIDGSTSYITFEHALPTRNITFTQYAVSKSNNISEINLSKIPVDTSQITLYKKNTSSGIKEAVSFSYVSGENKVTFSATKGYFILSYPINEIDCTISRVKGKNPTSAMITKILTAFKNGSLVENTLNFSPITSISGGFYIKVSYYYEVSSHRVYKGEGTINFVCNYPFARSRFKYLDSYSNLGIDYTEWSVAAGLLQNKEIGNPNYDCNHYYGSAYNCIPLYNPGDLEADLKFYLANPSYNSGGNQVEAILLTDSFPTNVGTTASPSYTISSNHILGGLYFTDKKFATEYAIDSSDSYVCIDMRKNLIYGCDSNFAPTGTLYNNLITNGDFFKVPMSPVITSSSNTSANKTYYMLLQTGGINRGIYNFANDNDGADESEIGDCYYYLYY